MRACLRLTTPEQPKNGVHPAVAGLAAPVSGGGRTGASRFGRTFWVLNTIEMWERLAFYNLRVMAPIYIMQADNPGGLHLTAGDKGIIYAWWAVFQSLLPVVTGGLADRFGYKRTLAFAISLMLIGYLMMAGLRDLAPLDQFAAMLSGIGRSIADWSFGASLPGRMLDGLTNFVGGGLIGSGNYWEIGRASCRERV